MDKVLQKTVEMFLGKMQTSSHTELITAEDELKKVVEKFGLDYEDTRDFGFFKNVYAVTDKANKNGAILPKDIVESNLSSLRGKPIDINHEREKVRGYYLGGELIDDVIYSYGVLFKSSFKEDWEKAEELFKEGKLNTSFEIWCPNSKRTHNEDGSYTLDEITFAGGAILWDDTPPAFDEAVVVDFAKKLGVEEQELVCAKEELIFADKKVKKEKAKMYTWDTNSIESKVYDMKCKACNEEYVLSIDLIDYENEKVKTTCSKCGAKYEIDMKPKMKQIEKALKEKQNEEERQMDELKQEIAKLKAELDTANAKIKELEEAKVKEAEEFAKKLEEAEKVNAEVEESKATIQEELDKANEVLKKIDEEAKAKEVAKRKEVLGDFAKDISDEDLLNEDKFAIAKMKKENAELREKAEKAGVLGDSEDKVEKSSYVKKIDDVYFKMLDRKSKKQ